MNTRVVIVDDHPLVRAGVAELLDDIPDVSLIGSAATGDEAVKLVLELRPDVMLLDLIMPGMSGFDVLSRIQSDTGFKLRTIVLSMHSSEEYVLRALKLRAAGFMLKDSVAEELEHAIQAVVGGQIWLSPNISKAAISAYSKRSENELL